MAHISRTPPRKNSSSAPALALANTKLSVTSSPLPAGCELRASCCHNRLCHQGNTICLSIKSVGCAQTNQLNWLGLEPLLLFSSSPNPPVTFSAALDITAHTSRDTRRLTGLRSFLVPSVRYCNRLSGEAAWSPAFEVFQTQQNNALRNLQ